METAFLIPNKNLIVRDPTTKEPLPEIGTIKTMIGPEGRFWRRRLKDVSVTINKQPSVIPKVEKQRKKGKED